MQAESAASMAQTEALGWDELGEYEECPHTSTTPLLLLPAVLLNSFKLTLQAESAASMAQTEALGWDELGEYAECPRCWHDPLSYSRQNKAAAPMPVLGHPQQPIPPGMAPYAPGMRRAGHESSSSSSAGTG
jgi:rubredoxin